MNFFVPQATRREQETAYAEIVTLFEEQMRWEVKPRRIQSIKYRYDKHDYYAEVGGLDPSEGRYEVLAILESNVYVVYARSKDGVHGTSTLVSKEEVYELSEFDAPKGA